MGQRGLRFGPKTHRSGVTLRVTTQRYSEVLTGTQGHTDQPLKFLTSTFVPPLQGEGRGFEPLSAHRENCT